MLYDDKVLEVVARLSPQQWDGVVYRHMFASYPPDAENTNGARWNPEEVPAIYSSLGRDIALAEAEYRISMQPNKPKARRTIYKIKVRLSNVLDISAQPTLRELGLTEDAIAGPDHAKCQAIGGAIEHQGNDGILVPSARANGLNLVIFPNRASTEYRFEVIEEEIIDPGMAW